MNFAIILLVRFVQIYWNELKFNPSDVEELNLHFGSNPERP